LLWAVLLGFPGYLLYAVIAAGIGVVAGDTQQAQQLAGFLGFFGLLPMWFAGTVVEAPNSPAAVGLSLFPLTGPIFSLLRMTFTRVPLWQLLASLGLILVSLAAAVWAVTRVFRAAMLLYGQTFGPRQILRALRQS
jgi:ABC-2 type transport system permease protein